MDVLLLKDGAFIRTVEGYAKLVACNDSFVCAEPDGSVDLPIPTPGGGLPDGTIATRAKGNIAEAWYADPTRRYKHGVLGDGFEAAALMARTRDGKTLKVELPANAVFEDLTPRLADLDGDGESEIVTIRSDDQSGARLSIWGLVGGKLVERAASEPIGKARRWLNPLPIVDGAPVMAVITPHLGGPLQEWTFEAGQLSPPRRLGGETLFSNHAIGSRDLSLAIRDGDRWAVPEKGRKALIFGEGSAVVARVSLEFEIDDDIAQIGKFAVVRSTAGQLHAIALPW